MLYWDYEGYLSNLHFLFFLVLLSQPWIEHFTHSSTSLFWTLHHKLYAYTHLNMTTTFTKHLNHTFTLSFQPANSMFMPGTFFCSYQLLLLTVGVAPWWRDTKIRVLETETFSLQLLQGQCFLLNLEGPCKLSFVRSISSVMTGYTRAFLSCRPLWFTGLVVLT